MVWPSARYFTVPPALSPSRLRQTWQQLRERPAPALLGAAGEGRQRFRLPAPQHECCSCTCLFLQLHPLYPTSLQPCWFWFWWQWHHIAADDTWASWRSAAALGFLISRLRRATRWRRRVGATAAYCLLLLLLPLEAAAA